MFLFVWHQEHVRVFQEVYFEETFLPTLTYLCKFIHASTLCTCLHPLVPGMQCFQFVRHSNHRGNKTVSSYPCPPGTVRAITTGLPPKRTQTKKNLDPSLTSSTWGTFTFASSHGGFQYRDIEDIEDWVALWKGACLYRNLPGLTHLRSLWYCALPFKPLVILHFNINAILKKT